MVIEGRASENEVAAELLDDQGRTAAIYRLDVSAADNKLGGQAFAAMVEAILDFDPALVMGTEEAQFGIGHDGALTNAHLQYARLRRYGDRFHRALTQISQRPLTTLKSDRTSVSAHTVKRLDSASVCIRASLSVWLVRVAFRLVGKGS